jgi:hypothetical protein
MGNLTFSFSKQEYALKSMKRYCTRVLMNDLLWLIYLAKGKPILVIYFAK